MFVDISKAMTARNDCKDCRGSFMNVDLTLEKFGEEIGSFCSKCLWTRKRGEKA